MVKLSIVIPVYNIEPYIERCLLSCIDQEISASEYEIIVINDGSPDGSLDIINRLIESYPNKTIIVYTQQNAGLSAARNKGISLAQGKYIWFVDGDDWIQKDCLIDIFQNLDGEFDCLTMDYITYYNEEEQFLQSRPFKGVKSGLDLIKQNLIFTPAQFTLYRRDFLYTNNLFFYEGIYHEDVELIPKIYYKATSCKHLNRVCYFYFQRLEGAITSSFKIKNARDNIFVSQRLADFGSDYITDKQLRSYFYNYLGKNVNSLLYNYYSLSRTERKEIISLFITRKKVFIALLKAQKIKYNIEGLFLLLFPRFTFILYHIFKRG